MSAASVADGPSGISSSKSSETWWRPEASLETVARFKTAPLGTLRDHLIAKGLSILASVSSCLAWHHDKAFNSNVADCRSFFVLNCGWRPSPLKKRSNAVFRFRRACCKGTALGYLSHA